MGRFVRRRCVFTMLAVSVLGVGCGGGQSTSATTRRGGGDGTEGSGDASSWEPSRDGESCALADAAIVSTRRGVAFVSEPEPGRGIAAVRLSDGVVLWRSMEADRPLAARGEILVAQEAGREGESGARIALMSSLDGSVRVHAEPIPLPEWVAPRPWYNGAIYAFESDAHIEGGDAIFRWDAHTSRYCGGMEGSGCMGTNARSVGAARIALDGGHVTVLDADAYTPIGSPPESPAFASLQGRLYGGSIPFSHAVIDGALHGTLMEERGGTKVLVQARFDPVTGEERSRFDITPEGRDEAAMSSAVTRYSEDGRHLSVTRLFMEPRPEYTRAIYELATGRLLDEHSIGNSSEPYIERFVVAGDRLVRVSRDGATLISAPITDDESGFTHSLRVTHGHGPPA